MFGVRQAGFDLLRGLELALETAGLRLELFDLQRNGIDQLLHPDAIFDKSRD